MKRKICLILACCLLFSTLVGCNNINTNNISQEQENMTETLSTKDTLILKQNPSISITSSYYTEEDIELSYSELYEMDTQQYVESRELKIFADFIKEKFVKARSIKSCKRKCKFVDYVIWTLSTESYWREYIYTATKLE